MTDSVVGDEVRVKWIGADKGHMIEMLKTEYTIKLETEVRHERVQEYTFPN